MGTPKTHCPHGHLMAGANVYVYPDGRRRCRACQREASSRYETRLRQKGPWAPGAPKMFCPQGHSYAGKNLYTAPDGSRKCRACQRAAMRRYKARMKEGK